MDDTININNVLHGLQLPRRLPLPSEKPPECQQSLTTFIDLCNKLGVPISTEKTILPSTSLVFLGIGINALRLELFIPPEKASTVLKELRDFLSKRTQRVKKWQSILGRLCHLSQVVTSGRIYLSGFYGSLQGILSQNSNCYRTIGAEAREDLEIWKPFLEQTLPTRPFRMLSSSSPTVTIYTDAAKTIGYGAVCGKQWFLQKSGLLSGKT